MTQLMTDTALADTIRTKDGTRIYFKDWGSGPPVVFSHGWPLTADAWEAQMFFLASNGYRCIAHDRRGHGRSSQPWNGNEMDTYADDLAELFEALDLEGAAMIGHSTGGGEVARFIGRHGTRRVSKAVLMGAVPPIMLKTAANPGGLPMEVFDGFRKAYLADRSQFFLEVASGPFFNFNRPGAKPSQGLINSWWRQGMMSGHKNAYDCIKAFSETDFTEDLKKFDVPTLIVHGDDDQIVPIGASALLSAKLVKNAELKIYQGRLAQPGRHLEGPAQRRPARVPEGVGAMRLDESHDDLLRVVAASLSSLSCSASPARRSRRRPASRSASPTSTARASTTWSADRAVRWCCFTATPRPATCGVRCCRSSPPATRSSCPTCAAPAARRSPSPATTRRTWPSTSTSSRPRSAWAGSRSSATTSA